MMLACLRRPQRTQAADAHDARLPAPAEVHNARFGGRTQAADAHDARFPAPPLKNTGG